MSKNYPVNPVIKNENAARMLSLFLSAKDTKSGETARYKAVLANIPAGDVVAADLAVSEHRAILRDCNESFEVAYTVLVPEHAYAAYVKMIDKGGRGEFLAACKEFNALLGIEGLTQAQINKFAGTMTDGIGRKMNSNAAYLKTGKMTAALSRKKFNELFVSTFVDAFGSKFRERVDGTKIVAADNTKKKK